MQRLLKEYTWSVLLIAGVVLVNPAQAQVVIKERVEVVPAASKADSSAQPAGIMYSIQQAGEFVYTAPEDGRFKVYYLQAERYGEALAADSALQVRIEREDEPEQAKDVVPVRFGEPVEVQSGTCTEDWHYYGVGPFLWCAPSDPASVQDAWVFSLPCDTDYAQDQGLCETTNFGSRPEQHIGAWTYLGDPGITRSFLQFDLSGFTEAATLHILGAALDLTPHGESQSQLSGSNAFAVSPVAQPWSESTITWVNQPGVGGPSVSAPGGTGPYWVEVAPIVQGWLDNPGSNHGFRLNLVEEAYYRRQAFGSSDGPSGVAPQLLVGFEQSDGETDEAVFAAVCAKQNEDVEVSYTPADRYETESRQMAVEGTVRDGAWVSFRGGTGCTDNDGTLCAADYDERVDVFVFLEENEYEIELEFSQDPDTYLPMQGDLIEVKATLDPAPPAGSTVTFELTHHDYGDGSRQFAFEDGSTEKKTVEVMGSEATVMLESKEYWGVVEVKATLDEDPPGCVFEEDQFPTDTDKDGIADVWELDAANGGSLALGGSDQDGNWDEETSPGNSNDGDGFTKLGEYQGVLIGDDHLRMTPDKKEVFFDIHMSSEGASAVDEIERQIGLKIYLFEGIAPTGLYPGSKNIKYLGVNTARRPAGMAFVKDAGVAIPRPSDIPNTIYDGLLVQGGVYAITSSSVPPYPFAIRFGLTTSLVATSGGVSNVYEKTIQNVWTNNSIPENTTTIFTYGITESGGHVPWDAAYSHSDLDGNGSAMDPVNPFDLLSPSGMANDMVDGVSAGFTESTYLKAVTLHEIGHALGMSGYGGSDPGHPVSGLSVMRSGWGPGRVLIFTVDDIKKVRLK